MQPHQGATVRNIVCAFVIAAGSLAACGSSDSGSGGGTGGSTIPQGSGGSGGTTIGTGGATTGTGGSTMAGGGATGTNTGAACHAAGTLQVTATGIAAYVIDGDSNPDLTFCRGNTYVFAINTPTHPFYINAVQEADFVHAYGPGVSGNGATAGNVTFAVPSDAPDTLYYNCLYHVSMTGTIHIVN